MGVGPTIKLKYNTRKRTFSLTKKKYFLGIIPYNKTLITEKDLFSIEAYIKNLLNYFNN